MNDLALTTDMALLQLYASQQDPEAFAELINRHAGLVYGTCKRVLGNDDDAQDVSQECFLELARKAGSVKSSIPAYLHHLARNRSIDTIRKASTRRRKEGEAIMTADSSTEPAWGDIAPLVDEVLSQLPERLRLPIILHYLEGRSQAEIAQELGMSQSTVSRNLDKGVSSVQESLRKAGVVVSVGALAGLLTENAVTAAPGVLMASLGKIAVVGVGGVTKAGTSVVAKCLAGLLVCAAAFAVHDLCSNRLSLADGTGRPVSATQSQANVRLDYGISMSGYGQIVFQGDGNGAADIYTMKTHTGPAWALTTTTDFEFSPAIDSRGGRVAYAASKEPGGPSHIYVMPATGGSPSQLTSDPSVYDCFPSFSKSGSKIVFARAARNRPYSMGGWTWDRYDIYTINSDGSGLRRVTNGKYNSADHPVYCKDDKLIAFAATTGSYPNTRDELLILDISGPPAKPKHLVDGSGCASSPDGKTIAYISDCAKAYDYELYTIDVDSRSTSRVTDLGSYITNPAFGPGGGCLLFLSDQQRDDHPQLWITMTGKPSEQKLADYSLFASPLEWKPGPTSPPRR